MFDTIMQVIAVSIGIVMLILFSCMVIILIQEILNGGI